MRSFHYHSKNMYSVIPHDRTTVTALLAFPWQGVFWLTRRHWRRFMWWKIWYHADNVTIVQLLTLLLWFIFNARDILLLNVLIWYRIKTIKREDTNFGISCDHIHFLFQISLSSRIYCNDLWNNCWMP